MVKALVKAFLALYLLALVPSCAPQRETRGDVVERLAEETRAGVSLLWSGSIPICTGTATTEAGTRIFLTAGHCLAEIKNFDRLYVERGSFLEGGVRVEVVRWKYLGKEKWKEGDFAILSLPEGSKLKPIPLCRFLPVPGERAWSWVGPMGMEPIFREGRVSGMIRFPANPKRASNGLVGVGFGVQKGASGAGVFKIEGEKPCLWGVIAGRPEELPDLSYVYPVLSDINHQ